MMAGIHEVKDDDNIPGDVAGGSMEMVTFTAIIDDIVFPDGRTKLACLGGGGPQSAFGALLWFSNGERVGLAAKVGTDFPDSCKDWLETAGIDTSGLVLWPNPTLRTWQFSEPLDGSIHEILEDEDRESESWDMVLPELNMLPPLYQKAKTYHAGVHPSGLDVPFLRALRDSGAEVLSVEVYMYAEEVVPYSELQALVSAGHIFSPNEREAASLVGAGTPLELIGRLSKLGAEIVVLRRGPLGCIVHRSDTKETWDVPAFHTVFYEGRKENCDTTMTKLQKTGLEGMDVEAILDPTGCGNTFCGGFLAGWYKTRNLLTAALWGSISASIMLEYEGIPPPMVSQWTAAAQQRLNFLQPHARKIVFT
ncbi:hypothetical protein KC19_9G107000 [Ceratodon purpureus]|uniref:Carbohydrate kinase PfkB domain-containing protein n=2 Tax=Ceratodon purpureus TaxID=3225 RepID=A0A8T0GV03_CERPU|nr:hypothetical protein KC19_9G107000 [Ceratodon purpureus]